MALKFLNKKGWHTGSLRNIENVWKAEQKHEAEQRKLEELKKQILEERDRDEFRQLQVDAGLTPRQDRLEFLYDSGLAVGRSSTEGFNNLPSLPPPPPQATNNSASASASASGPSNSSAPGALFEEKPQSANDSWRKLNDDPLLKIRKKEQESLAHIKNNPVRMAMIRKAAEMKKKGDKADDEEHKKVKSKHKRHSSSKRHSDSENDSDEELKKVKSKHKRHSSSKRHSDSENDSDEEHKKVKSKHRRHSLSKRHSDSENDSEDDRERKRKGKQIKKEHLDSDEDSKDRARRQRHSERDHSREKLRDSSPQQQKRKPDRIENRERLDEDSRDRSQHHRHSHRDRNGYRDESRRGDGKERHEKHPSDSHNDRSVRKEINNDSLHRASDSDRSALPPKHESYRRRGKAPQLSEEERAAKLREMQMDAEVHEEQRWKRLKKAAADDALEASKAVTSRGKSFLHDVQKSVYGAEKGGSSTIEESVRRRSHFLQGRSAVDEQNAFRR